MKINRIEINGLFYKYNVSVDMSRKCNIIVGANGIGKTTILKIINCLLHWNFIDLAKYHFINISVEGIKESFAGERESYNICFSRSDLVPEVSKVVERYQKYWNSTTTGWLENVLNFLISKDCYPEFIYHLYKHDSESEVIKRAIVECSSDINIFQHFNEYFVSKIEECLSFFESKYCFYQSKIDDLLRKEELDYVRNVPQTYILNLVQGVTFEKMASPLYSSKTLKWMNMCSELGDNQIEHDAWDEFHNTELTPIKEQQMWHLVWLQAMGGRLNIPPYFFRTDGMPELQFWKYMYQNLNDLTSFIQEDDDQNNEMISRQQHCLHQFMRDNKFHLNELITFNYYKEGIAIRLNKELANFCVDITNGTAGYGDSLEQNHKLITKICAFLKIDPETINVEDEEDDFDERYRAETALSLFYNDPTVRFNIENYFIPILAEDFPIDFSKIYDTVGKITLSEDVDFDYCSLCLDFYLDVVDEFTSDSNKSERILIFQNRMEEYFPNRKICITPSGLRFFDKDEFRDGIIPLYKMHTKEITLNAISSGEKKIILLLAVAYLTDDITILIDEPELSLSIVWQKNIMEDLKAGGLNNITVATHSPYLISSEELRQETVFLP